MCGIVGYIGNHPAWPIVLEGLQRLEYRGYDSAGIAVLDRAGQLRLRKTVGKVDGLTRGDEADYPDGTVGLGHTRWATHGPPTDANAHPLTGCHRQIAVVHNGIVENYLELKRGLQERGHIFSSETDTEVIAHLIEEGLGQGLSFPGAFREMGRRLEGSQAVAAVCRLEPDKLCALRVGHAGGIVVAHRDGQGIVGSDLPAALPILRQRPGPVAYLEPGEMALVTRQGVRVLDLDGNTVQKEMRTVSPQDALVDRGGYRHFMLKEIMEQPQAVAGALRGRVNFDAGRVELSDFPFPDAEAREIQRVVLTGCGTSLNAALAGRFLVERFAGLPAEVESASEYRYREPYLDSHTLVVAITQSGETADTIAAMQDASERGARVVVICNAEESEAARLADGALLMGSGIEIGVASTKTFVASVTILFLLAIYLGQIPRVPAAGAGLVPARVPSALTGEGQDGSERIPPLKPHLSPEQTSVLIRDLARCPRLIGEMLADVSQYRKLAQKFSGYNSFLYLGRGINSAIAQEGALKLKEISYIHAEGYPAGEMKHGPIALIDRHMATLALAPRDGLYDKMAGNIREVRARRGVVLAVLTRGDTDLAAEVDDALFLPQAPDYLYPLLSTIPLQLLAYYIALDRGCDVDQPRNLAKSVTVE